MICSRWMGLSNFPFGVHRSNWYGHVSALMDSDSLGWELVAEKPSQTQMCSWRLKCNLDM